MKAWIKKHFDFSSFYRGGGQVSYSLTVSFFGKELTIEISG